VTEPASEAVRRREPLRSPLGLLCALLLGCGALVPRVAPVQSARVVQTESFRQSYRIENVVRAERVFRTLLGPDNYGALTPEEWVPYIEKIVAGQIEAAGAGTFAVSLMPQDHDQFFFEGWGHYGVVDRTAKQILVSGEFTAIDDGPHSTREFEQGFFDTRVRQTLVRHFAPHRPSFVHEFVLVLRVHVKRIDEDLFILDYTAGHEIGVENEHGRVEVVGCVEFEHHADGRKVIDLRGRDLIRDDYAEKLGEAGLQRAARRRAPQWLDLVECKPPAEGPNCACGPGSGSASGTGG